MTVAVDEGQTVDEPVPVPVADVVAVAVPVMEPSADVVPVAVPETVAEAVAVREEEREGELEDDCERESVAHVVGVVDAVNEADSEGESEGVSVDDKEVDTLELDDGAMHVEFVSLQKPDKQSASAAHVEVLVLWRRNAGGGARAPARRRAPRGASETSPNARSARASRAAARAAIRRRRWVRRRGGGLRCPWRLRRQTKGVLPVVAHGKRLFFDNPSRARPPWRAPTPPTRRP